MKTIPEMSLKSLTNIHTYTPSTHKLPFSQLAPNMIHDLLVYRFCFAIKISRIREAYLKKTPLSSCSSVAGPFLSEYQMNRSESYIRLDPQSKRFQNTSRRSLASLPTTQIKKRFLSLILNKILKKQGVSNSNMDLKVAVCCVLVLLSLFCGHSQGFVCKGLGADEYVSGNNLPNFQGCTVVDGDLRIMEATFTGDSYYRTDAVHPRDLYMLEDIEEITGHLVIQGEHPEFKNLDFLRNLRNIRGTTLSYVSAALQIYGTSLTSLELKSLEKISDGIVVVGHNQDLCFVDNINWSRLFEDPTAQRTSIKFNKNPQQCGSDNQVCDEECSGDGCWGTGDRNCLECANVEFQGQCLSGCYRIAQLYQNTEKTCARCHPECDGCSGPGTDQCDRCQNFKYRDSTGRGVCVPQCPDMHYVDYENTCQRCHPQCRGGCSDGGSEDCFECQNMDDERSCVEFCPTGKYADSNMQCQKCNEQCAGGCIGPGSSECDGGCKNMRDVGSCVEACPFGKYADYSGECQPCDEQCAGGCVGAGSANCDGCKNVKDGDTCVENCPLDKYADDTNACQQCDEQCGGGCTGPSSRDCFECSNMKDGEICVENCPVDKYADDTNVCQQCNEQCDGGCTGPDSTDCFECSNMKDGDDCVENCPLDKYADDAGVCRQCDEQCDGGCTGPDSTDCFECSNMKDGDECVENCPLDKYADDADVCRQCDRQCDGGCIGPGSRNCFECRNVKDGEYCVDNCPLNKYADDTNVCRQCNEQCDGGCRGPGSDNCFDCANMNDGGYCVANCPLDKYPDAANECQRCDDQCDGGCIGPGRLACLECKHFKDEEGCVESCPHGKFSDVNGDCQLCHPQCDSGCTGPGADDCYACRNVKDEGFCAPECPDYKFADYNSNCQQCDIECLHGCYGEGPGMCIACRNYRDGSRCVSRCPVGQCPDTTNTCGPCNELPTFEQLVAQVKVLQDQASELKAYVDDSPAVWFSAYSQPERMDYYAGEQLLFNGVITNIGGGYFPEKSNFICPRTGLYLFAVSVDNYMRGSLVPSIYKGRELIASAGAYNSASQTVIVECEKGETVHVRTSQAGTMFNMYGWKTSTFTGYLLANGKYSAGN